LCDTGKIITYTFDEDDVKMYDGETISSVAFTDYNTVIKNSHKFVKVKSETVDDLKTDYDEFIKKAEFYKSEHTLLNYYATDNTAYLAYNIWCNKSKTIKKPEQILPVEEIPLSQSNRGGLHYGKRVENGYEYDYNNFYLNNMSSSNFNFPNCQPDEIKTITTKEFNELPFICYGLYKCKITGNSMYVPKSMCDTYQWINHFNLQIAKSENLTIEFDEHNGCNNMLYTHERLNGKVVFKDHANFVDGLKQKHRGTKCYDNTKQLNTSLWGFLCRKNKNRQTYKVNENIYYNNFDDIEEIRYAEKSTTILSKPTDKLFKTDYARIGSFLTGFSRLQLYKFIKANVKDNDILYINTDSIITTKPLPETLYCKTNEIGKLKLVVK